MAKGLRVELRVDHDFITELDRQRGRLDRSEYIRGLVMTVRTTNEAGGESVRTKQETVRTEASKTVRTNAEGLVQKLKKDWSLAGDNYRVRLADEANALGYTLSAFNRTLKKGDEVIPF